MGLNFGAPPRSPRRPADQASGRDRASNAQLQRVSVPHRRGTHAGGNSLLRPHSYCCLLQSTVDSCKNHVYPNHPLRALFPTGQGAGTSWRYIEMDGWTILWRREQGAAGQQAMGPRQPPLPRRPSHVGEERYGPTTAWTSPSRPALLPAGCVRRQARSSMVCARPCRGSSRGGDL